MEFSRKIMPIKRKKLDADVEIPQRLVKLISCSLGMESLLEECKDYFYLMRNIDSAVQRDLVRRIELMLKRTGRLP